MAIGDYNDDDDAYKTFCSIKNMSSGDGNAFSNILSKEFSRKSKDFEDGQNEFIFFSFPLAVGVEKAPH
jgi:hypothetical protein